MTPHPLSLVAIMAASCLTMSSPARLSAAPDIAPNLKELWEQPADLASRDLFNGPWGAERAPASEATYTFVEPKKSGINRGMTVRDLGTALGGTARVTPIRGNPAVFEKLGFIDGVKHGFLEFAYEGRHRHLVDRTISPTDVRWASGLVAGLTREQWRDAFRAGGYDQAVSDRFIDRLLAKVRDGLALGGAETR